MELVAMPSRYSAATLASYSGALLSFWMISGQLEPISVRPVIGPSTGPPSVSDVPPADTGAQFEVSSSNGLPCNYRPEAAVHLVSDDALLSRAETWALVGCQPLAQLSNQALLPSLGSMRADLDLSYIELG